MARGCTKGHSIKFYHKKFARNLDFDTFVHLLKINLLDERYTEYHALMEHLLFKSKVKLEKV